MFWVQYNFSQEDGHAIGGDIPAVSGAPQGLKTAPITYQWLNNKHTIEIKYIEHFIPSIYPSMY